MAWVIITEVDKNGCFFLLFFPSSPNFPLKSTLGRYVNLSLEECMHFLKISVI